jgi:hypothetical protein
VAYFVKVIPPSRRARIHAGDCDHCRDGRGQEKQDKGSGPTYWQPKFPAPGYQTVAAAQAFMDGLGSRYADTGQCQYCMKSALNKRLSPAR